MPQTRFSDISDKYTDEIKDNLLDAFRNIYSSLEAKISNKKDLSDLILHQNRQLSSEDIKLQQKPESFTKDNIIKPLLLSLGYKDDNFAKETKQKLSKHDRWADYTLIVGNDYVLVEAEPMKKSLRMDESGLGQVQEWIESKRTNTDYGIATNGLEWIMVKFDRNSLRLRELKSINLQPIFSSFLGQEHLTTFDEVLKDFYLTFSKDTIISSFKERYYTLEYQCDQISHKFYSEYIEYVFGISSKDGSEREYSLLKAISKPHSATLAETNLFAITFMNRILFIKFLEDKGLIEKDLLVNLWNEYAKINDSLSSFYKNILEPLFFNVFNTPVQKRSSKIKINERFAKIPYLNGGLFRETLRNETQYSIEDDIIGKILLDFLGHYDFTISGEGLNPDVLGNIFERTINYISNPGSNKQKLLGAYYTPDDITTYMTIKAIHPFLLNKIKEYLISKGWKDPDVNEYRTLDDFLNNLPENPMHLKNILDIVSEITVLDPACGSGHFLTAALNELMYVKEILFTRIGKSYSRYHIKKETISQNIFGVDIDESAVEIAKLRLWLSLIEDVDTGSKKHIETLPNIEYNLVCGNSLIGWVNEKLFQTSLAIPMTDEVKGIFKGLLVGPNEDTDSIEKARDLLEGPALEDYIEAYCILYSIYKNSTDEKAVRLKEILITVRDAIYNSVNHSFLNYINQQMNSTKLKRPGVSLQKFLELRPFHWRVDFGPIIRKGGFDIVIGNPPYVRADTEDEKHILQRKIIDGLTDQYQTLFEKWDIFVAFIERSIRGLLNPYGQFCFIVSDALCTVKYSEKMRAWLSKEYYLPSIDYFENFQVFKGVGVVPIIIYVDKNGTPKETTKYLHDGSFDNIASAIVLDQKDSFLFKKVRGDILSYNYSNCIFLESICFISKGIVPNSDEFLAKGEFTKEDIISDKSTAIHEKIYVEGKDLERFRIRKFRYMEWNTDRVPSKISRPTFEELYHGKKILRGRVTEGIIDNQNIINNDSILVFKRYIDLKGIENNSIRNSLKKHNNLPREELEEISSTYTYEYLLAIINSTFANKYLNAIRRHKLNNYFYPDDFRALPIKKNYKQHLFEKLVNLIQFLYYLDSEYSSYFDEDLLDSLVYELYFKDKFVEDGTYSGIKIDLASLLEGCIPKIKYDEWSALYWKKKLGEDLSPKEEQSLNSLEKDNLEIIKSTYDTLTKNKEIAELINRIKSNDWIKLIEGQ